MPKKKKTKSNPGESSSSEATFSGTYNDGDVGNPQEKLKTKTDVCGSSEPNYPKSYLPKRSSAVVGEAATSRLDTKCWPHHGSPQHRDVYLCTGPWTIERMFLCIGSKLLNSDFTGCSERKVARKIPAPELGFLHGRRFYKLQFFTSYSSPSDSYEHHLFGGTVGIGCDDLG